MKIRQKDEVSDGDYLPTPKSFYSELQQLTNCLDDKKLMIIPKERKRNRIETFFEVPMVTRTLEEKSSIFDSEKVIIKDNSNENNHLDMKNRINFSFKLKEIMHKQKVKSIVSNFKQKIKRNNCESEPVQYEPYEVNSDNSLLSKDGIQIGKWFKMAISLISIAQIIFLGVTYSLALIFNEVRRNEIVQNFSIFSFIFYFLEFLLNFISIKEKQGKKITVLREIINYYIYGKFLIDLLCIVILFIDIMEQFQLVKYLRLCILFKIGGTLDKLELLEGYLINSFYTEQYWGLAKVFLLNFFFAHLLSICLLGMAELTPNNWLTKIGAAGAPWYQQYAWSYYWGTTIMLTVGFGDLSATNYQEAICLTMIQTFSCIALAYNINCVGNLISNIRSQDIEKQRKFKIMNQLAARNSLQEDLLWKINNYIQETTKMKKIFNIEEEKEFITSLPPGLRTNFLKESNKKIFQNLLFFSNFTERTLINLAQKLEMFVSYPEQIVFNQEKAHNFLILREGKIGYCTKLIGSDFNETIFNEVKIKEGNSPSLLSLDFLFHKPINYEIKTLKYSLMYQIEFSVLKEMVQQNTLDFENFCMILDRSNHILDEFQLVNCQSCKTLHGRIRCPRLHFIPIKQHVINKHLRDWKKLKQQRKEFSRIQFVKKSSLSYYIKNRELFKVFEEKKNSQKKKMKRSFTIRPPMESDEISKEGILPAQIEWKLTQLSENLKIVTQHLDNSKNIEGLWEIQCDEINDFKFYFSSENAKFLEQKYPGIR